MSDEQVVEVQEPAEVTGNEEIIEVSEQHDTGHTGGFSLASVPWMKISAIEPGVAKTVEEAAELSGLNFNVVQTPVEFVNPTGQRVRYASRYVTVREDSGVPLGIVSDIYETVQYGEAFAFMDAVSPHFVAAGELNGGKQGFMVVRLDDVTVNPLGGDDEHTLYAVLRTSHDRTRAIEVVAMPLRHKCMNQLTLPTFALGAEYRWSFRHTTNVHARLQEAQTSVQRLSNYAKAYEEVAERLQGITLTNDNAVDVIMRVLPTYMKKKDDVVIRVLSLWKDDPRVAVGQTGWGLVQAVSTYYDHDRPGGSPQSRFLSALQGTTHKAIERTAALVLSRHS